MAESKTKQRMAEDWLVAVYSENTGVKLIREDLPMGEGGSMEIPGFSASPKVLCEVWPRIGKLTHSQKNEVMAKVLKLLFADKVTEGKGKLMLLFACHKAAAHFQGDDWMAGCLRSFGIEIDVTHLPDDLK